MSASLESTPAANIRALFLGTSSMAWTDGRSTWLVDGFFSRQPLSEVIFTRLKVDETQVSSVASEMFKRLNMPSTLTGIVVAHSHYDHSMDAPWLAKQYGARVVGSESTWQIAKGQDLPATQMDVMPGNGRVKLGEFEVQLIESAHAPTGFTGGFNAKPVFLPAHALQFKEGISYSFVVSHPDLGPAPFALIQPSAGFVPGQNKGVNVKHVFLGTGGLGKSSDAYISDYWQEMVVNTGAKQVYLIHWDDFTQPLINQGQLASLKPMPKLLDDFPRSLELLKMFSERDGVTLHVLDAWKLVNF
ncbi:MBL fold metallo-hydrolase [Limnobacter sp. 130]|uniref:MBL fold metallo-hydrolase n=1 Tax=Limnobacter sp. 130 TaxID=2653147 RepID=UPI0013584152|nr:MBL fold metallo-hydrolase [Limnobacter sp. 130]